MTGENSARVTTVEEASNPELEAMQETALQLEVDIFAAGEDGEELTLEELTTAVEAKQAELALEAAREEDEKEAARESARQAEAAARANAEAKSSKRKKRGKSSNVATVQEGQIRLIDNPSTVDIELANKHGYPVAIAGASAYRCIHSMHCAYGGGLRHIGSVILLTDEHAANKRTSIKRIE